jgi:hypothetical protein
MIRCLEIQEGGLFKDRGGLEVKVERIDANKRIRFSVVGNQATIAGPGEMSRALWLDSPQLTAYPSIISSVAEQLREYIGSEEL